MLVVARVEGGLEGALVEGLGDLGALGVRGVGMAARVAVRGEGMVVVEKEEGVAKVGLGAVVVEGRAAAGSKTADQPV